MDTNVDWANETREELEAIYESLDILKTNADHFFVLVMSLIVFCEYVIKLLLLLLLLLLLFC